MINTDKLHVPAQHEIHLNPGEEIKWTGQPHKWATLWSKLMGMFTILAFLGVPPLILLLYAYFANDKVYLWQQTALIIVFVLVFAYILFSHRPGDVYH